MTATHQGCFEVSRHLNITDEQVPTNTLAAEIQQRREQKRQYPFSEILEVMRDIAEGVRVMHDADDPDPFTLQGKLHPGLIVKIVPTSNEETKEPISSWYTIYAKSLIQPIPGYTQAEVSAPSPYKDPKDATLWDLKNIEVSRQGIKMKNQDMYSLGLLFWELLTLEAVKYPDDATKVQAKLTTLLNDETKQLVPIQEEIYANVLACLTSGRSEEEGGDGLSFFVHQLVRNIEYNLEELQSKPT